MRNVRWGDVAQLKYGKSIRGYGEESSDSHRFRVFGTNGPIGWHTSPLVAKAGIIIGRKGAYRGVHFSAEPFFVIDTAYFLDIHDPQVDVKWAYYQLLTVDINRMDSGSAIPSTKREDFDAVPVRIPPLSSQKCIAAILSAYDDLIENNRRRMALLEESARLLYREWFVRLRFPGYEHTRLRDGVPDGWKRRTLGDCLTLKRGHDLPESRRVPGTVPIVSSSGITGFHIEKKADGPGIVTGRYGTLGEVYFVEEDYWPHNTALYVCDFKGNHPRVLFYYLKDALQSVQSNNAAVPGLNRNVLHTLPVLWPSAKLRNHFDEFLELTFRQRRLLRQMSEKLQTARDLLLPRLMSGEIAV